MQASKEARNMLIRDNAALTIPANTFEVTLAQIPTETYDGVTMPTSLTADIQVSPSGEGFFEFEEIKFTKPGTFKFSVKEDVTNPIEGVTYDTSEKTVTITVTKENGEFKGLKLIVNQALRMYLTIHMQTSK